MSPFWVGLFENLRGRGRNATLFLIALAALFGVLLVSGVLAEILSSKDYGDYARIVLTLVGIVVVIWFGRMFCRGFFAKYDRSNISRLSSDELTKARSKLLRNQKRGSL
jgi:arginine exporter protein ArgO